MSQENADLVDDYKRENGAYIYKTSRHSLIAGPYRRGAPTNLIRVSRDINDPLVAKFFERVDAELVEPHIIQQSATLRARRATAALGYRTGPILRIAEELGLFAHLEAKEVRKRFFPTYPTFRIARAGDEVKNPRTNEKLRYTIAENGNNRFTFREWVPGTNNHAGIRSRGYGSNDASDKGKAGNTLEPQINMRKYDPSTGEPINDKRIDGELADKRDRRVGDWRAEMVTLPLVAAVRELQAGEATYPVSHSPFSRDMSRDERIRAGFENIEPEE
jgi:hypothetical protein